MGFQCSLEAALGAFIAFYIGCAVVGRPDIPLKVVTELRVKAMQGTTASWDCPSLAHHDACRNYDSRRYR